MKKTIINELTAGGMSGAEADHAFREVVGAMVRVVRRGDRLRLPGIGTIVRTTRAETRRRLPGTDETITIASRDVVALRNPEKF